AARHQAFDHVAADRRRRDPLHDERVEAVEGAEHALNETSALGGVRVYVRQPREAFGQRRLAVHGDAMPRLGGIGFAGGLYPAAAEAEDERQRAAGRRTAWRPATEQQIEKDRRAHGGRGPGVLRMVPNERSGTGCSARTRISLAGGDVSPHKAAGLWLFGWPKSVSGGAGVTLSPHLVPTHP